MFREGPFSSLVTRLTLAVLAVLLLSLVLTTVAFVAQSQIDERRAAAAALNPTLAYHVRGVAFTALLNSSGDPLTHIDPAALGISRVLLTTFPSDQVAYDTAGPPSAQAAFPVSKPAGGPIPYDGADYYYRAVPLVIGDDQDLAALNTNVPYRYVISLVRARSLWQRTWSVVTQLTLPGAVGVVISLLAALAVVRAITRPLHSMTLASERMAGGDYDQQVSGADSADEVGQLARSFNHMAHEVKRVREAQRQFVANVSHDLRSPLTSIIGFSQALTEDDTITPAQRRAAEIIQADAERLHRLTLDLLDLSRLEAGRLPLSREPLDLTVTLRAIATRYHALPVKRGVRFVDRLGGEPLPMLADADRLTQVVVNLVDNAFKFCDEGGEVRLSAHRRGDTAVIEIFNSGAAIAPKDLPRVFDRFYRADHSRAQQTGGSGIGLAIVRELVLAHDGQVTAGNVPGTGVIMTVRLPLAPDIIFTKDLQAANSGATGMRV